MATSNFNIRYTPHEGQQEVAKGIYEHPEASVITLDAARGWGKTIFAVQNLVIPHIKEVPNAQIMWVAPTYKICKAPIDDVFYGYDDKTGERFIEEKDEETDFTFWEYKKGDMEIHFWNNAKIFFRSADNPDSIVSKGYSLIIVDEAAIISESVFNKQILATARRHNCKIVLISTPRGKNWFYHK